MPATASRPRRSADGWRIAIDAPDARSVRVDSARVEQALTSLVDNALRYGAGTIGFGAHAADGRLELHVVDEGDGFPTASLPVAFERFSRAPEMRSRPGTGLGLALVAAIAASHGGSAHAANLPTGGADVWLSLPDPEGDRTRPAREGGERRKLRLA